MPDPHIRHDLARLTAAVAQRFGVSAAALLASDGPPLADHSRCFPLEKFDRCARCEKPIGSYQPFHLTHDDCTHPNKYDLPD